MIRLFRTSQLLLRPAIGRMAYSTVPPPPPPVDDESEMTKNVRASIKNALLCAQDKMGRCNCWKEGGYCGAETHAIERRLKTSLSSPKSPLVDSNIQPVCPMEVTLQAKLSPEDFEKLGNFFAEKKVQVSMLRQDEDIWRDTTMRIVGSILGIWAVVAFANWDRKRRKRKNRKGEAVGWTNGQV